MDLDAFRRGLDDWLDRHEPELRPGTPGPGTLAEQMAQLAKVKQMGFDAGWMGWGWPERVGGKGGGSILRAYLGEALMARRLVEPGCYSMTEVLAPSIIGFAPPQLAASMVPRLLRGDEMWCQGFSEPGTGSNLAALACRAVRADDGWHVSGQKIWTSYAQFSARCVLLTRTGPLESAHRGITALFVDMDTPGITVRPITTMHGAEEFCEVFFDDVRVPLGRTLGQVDGGWAVAMDLLPYERSTSLWHRAAWLQRRLEEFLAVAPEDAVDPGELGQVVQMLWTFRARSRRTQRRLAAGARLGAETSVDKVLLAGLEQALFELVGRGLEEQIAVGEGEAAETWRADVLYSRAATIYGGSAEIQRNIIARRLLDLGDDR